MEVSTRNETEGKFSSVYEEVSRNQERKGMEETILIVVCEHVQEMGKQQSPAQVKAQPKKRRAVIRVESAETQDYVSEPQGLRERDTKKRWRS